MAQTILYLHGIGSIGGAERDLLTMLQGLNRDEWEPHVACPADTPLSDLLAKEDTALHPLEIRPWRKWRSFFTRRRDLRLLRELMVRVAPALIHVNDIWWVPHTLGAVSARGLRKPIVAHVRQEIEPQKVRRYGLDSVDRVIAISRQVEQSLIDGGVGREAVQTIYSGVPLPNDGTPSADRSAVCRALGFSADAVLLGTVAHLFPRKGHDVMLRALPRIMAEVPTVQYLIIGTGDDAYERALKTLAATLGIADRVHFLGFQEDVAPFLSALSLYVHPARMEGFGIAVVEALAAGKAVVATRVGGVPEVVDEGRTGLLVAPEQPEELSAAVLALLRDDAKRKAMEESGMHAARSRFDVKASVAAMERLYRQLVRTGQERA
ncbi:MAG TPA: glycosyltransferase family 4 protein [Nitrospira sp.]|nr:glycosyltransferase family 4 protein [Nitrospira sp.]